MNTRPPKRMRSMTLPLVSGVLICLSGTVPATEDGYSPRRLGAFSGAMKHCEERHDEKGSRYQRVRMRIAREVDGMSRRDKERALDARDSAYERGRFLGKRLDRDACRSLLRQSEWQRYRDD